MMRTESESDVDWGRIPMLMSFTKCNILILLLGLAILCLPALSQSNKSSEKGSNADKNQLTFKVPVDVVVVTATVTDKQGKPVRDLTVDDFKLFEDGKPRPIHTFSLESYKTTQSLAAAGRAPVPAPAAAAEPADRPNRPRMFSFLIDDMASSYDHFPATIEAIRKFVTEDMTPGDQVAIYSASGSIQDNFSDDRQLLLAEIGALPKKLVMRPIGKADCPSLTDLQARNIATNRLGDDAMNVAFLEAYACMALDENPNKMRQTIAEPLIRANAMQQYQENQYRARVLIQTLRQHVRSLRHFEAQKGVILFSDGFLLEDVMYELQDAVDQALRAGVVLNTVDVRGLYVAMFNAKESSAGSVRSGLSYRKQAMLAEDMSAKEDPLSLLAHDTGGIFHHNSNDLGAGAKAVAERETFQYVLSYAAPGLKADGKYHKIKLEVSRPDLTLNYRNGYYAPREQLSFERRKKEDILEAIRAPGNVKEIPIRLSFNSSQFDDTRYEVELVTHVDIRKLQFAEEDSRLKNLISMVIVAYDESNKYVDGVQKDISFNLAPESYTELMAHGFDSKVIFRIPPGRYKIKAVIRESVRTKIGSLTRWIEIP
jgi:VWFA-related protein